MSSRVQIVQRVENKSKLLKPFYVELRVFDIRVISFELNVRVEFGSRLFSYLEAGIVSLGMLNWGKMTDQRF